MNNSNSVNNSLSDEEKTIKSYFESELCFSTEPIDRDKAAKAIEAAYRLVNISKPSILFFDSPKAMVEEIIEWTGKDTLYEIRKFIRASYNEKLRETLLKSGKESIMISREMSSIINTENNEFVKLNNSSKLYQSYYNDYERRLEFRVDEIDIHIESSLSEKLAYVYGTIRYLLDCNRIFYSFDTCFVCDRPTKLLFDDDCLLADPADKVLEYHDGFFAYSVYDDSDEMLEIKKSKYQTVTESQKAQIQDYFTKWSNIVLSTQPIDRNIAKLSVQELYHFLELTQPDIIYFPSPLAVIKQIQAWKVDNIEFRPNPEIRQLFICFLTEVESEIFEKYGLDNNSEDWYSENLEELWSDKYGHLLEEIRENIDRQLQLTEFYRWYILGSEYSLFTQSEANSLIKIDYAFSVLNVPGKQRKEWQLYQDLVKNCGWIIFGMDKVLICDRIVVA